jgi:nitrite reductase/ring-hydroxylating ferredoxin subunit
MPDSKQAGRQLLCASGDIPERGDAFMFDVLEFGRSAQAFALRHEHGAVAYVNRCAHVPVEMDWQPRQFWDSDRQFIICSVHGALYDPATGRCVAGPCVGARLHAIQLNEEGGQVYWYPSDRIQPPF